MPTHEHAIKKFNGAAITMGDLREVMKTFAHVPDHYEVVVSCEEMDVSELCEVSLELLENDSSDGAGSMILGLVERD